MHRSRLVVSFDFECIVCILFGYLGILYRPCLNLLKGDKVLIPVPFDGLLGLLKSAFGPELAYRLRIAQPTLMDVPFDILLHYYICLRNTFLLPFRFGWLLVLSLWKEDYLHFFFINVCPFDYTTVPVSGKVDH